MIDIPSSKEIKTRISNGQIKLNGDLIMIEDFRRLNLDNGVELGEFLFKYFNENFSNWDTIKKEAVMFTFKMFDTEVWADTNSPLLMEIFKRKSILKLSKKEFYVIDKMGDHVPRLGEFDLQSD